MKIFRDNVHGYIDIPVDYVKSFIDTEIFQRLRGIEQTGMRTLYPSARHDRFIHSLGTYFLGHKAFYHFRKNVKSTYNETSNSDHYNVLNNMEESEKFWDKYGVLFEIACLLHDCGHAPFSHTLEFHYDKESISGEMTLKEKLMEYNGSNEFLNDYTEQGSPGSPHERMSALLVCSEFKATIDKIINDYELGDVEENCSNVEFIVRAIIGCRYKNTTIHENQIKNCLIELLNSKSIDVDSLDYIVRDSKLSGVDNMNIDIERLLGSLTLVEITICNDVHLRDREISTNIVQGELIKNNKNNANFNGKIRGNFVVENQIQGSIAGMVDLHGSFKTNNEVKIIPEDNISIITVNGAKINDKLPYTPEIASIVIFGDIDSKLNINGQKLNFGLHTNGKFDFSFESIKFHSSYINGKINGVFSGQLLGNHKNLLKSSVECRLGFHKSSLSVIQNVIIARNYEYQWIYSHHKVVYYSNYLIIDLLRQCIEYLKKDNVDKFHDDNELTILFSWKNMISDENKKIGSISNIDIYRPTDADIMAIFKKCYLKCMNTNETESALYSLLNEYYSRVYKHSLWKSFAEFNTFFSDFTQNERNNIFNMILENSSYKLLSQYGYLSNEWSEKFSEFGLNNVVWVNGDSKLKNLDPDSTFILFKDGPLTYRSISSNNEIKPVTTLNLFYIYYFPSSTPINKLALVDFLKKKLRERGY